MVTSQHPQLDLRSFPGGYDLDEIVSAIQISAIQNVGIDLRRNEVEHRILEDFWTGLQARHPGKIEDPFWLRSHELMEDRSLLAPSHLRLSWFTLAYWSYVMIAVRSRLAPHAEWQTKDFIERIRCPLFELGVDVTETGCLDQIDRFALMDASPKDVVNATLTFMDFVRFLQRAALRRRHTVTPGSSLASVGLVCDRKDEGVAREIVSYLTSHEIQVVQRTDQGEDASRLLVLLSQHTGRSEEFWRDVAAWRSRPVSPMVLCLAHRGDLYRERPRHAPEDLWAWLCDTVAVDLDVGGRGYSVLLQALEPGYGRRWWWHAEDGMVSGLAVDLLGKGIPRPSASRASPDRVSTAYPYGLEQTVLRACVSGFQLATGHARDGFIQDAETGRHEPYATLCSRFLVERRQWCGDAYALPWFIVAYRAWLTFAADEAGLPHGRTGADEANRELVNALVSLGVVPHKADALGFLEGFKGLPWAAEADAIAAVDERATCFVALVYSLSQSAVAAHQPVQLAWPFRPCFVSYARQDEGLARRLASFVEGKGADVWFDLTSITLGMPLDESLRDAVSDARILFLIASSAADGSSYVRMEIETALERGLRILPVEVDDGLPPGITAVQTSNSGSFLPPVRLGGADDEGLLVPLLDHLRRSPGEQLRWLRSQHSYARMVDRLRTLRADGERRH